MKELMLIKWIIELLLEAWHLEMNFPRTSINWVKFTMDLTTKNWSNFRCLSIEKFFYLQIIMISSSSDSLCFQTEKSLSRLSFNFNSTGLSIPKTHKISTILPWKYLTDFCSHCLPLFNSLHDWFLNFCLVCENCSINWIASKDEVHIQLFSDNPINSGSWCKLLGKKNCSRDWSK